MYILIISILSGIALFMIFKVLIESLKNLQIQSKFSKKAEQIKGGFDFKGVTGFLYFTAQKIGGVLEKRKHQKLELLAKNIESNTAVLGAPYTGFTPYTFMGIQILSGIGLVVFTYFVLDITNLFMVLIFAVLGMFLPYYMIKEKVKSKHKAIFRQIPDVLDLLTLMIEAGLDFNASLNRIAASEKGELIDEFSKVLGEIKLGKQRQEAYADMAKRINYTPLTSVISSINNALNTGGSLGATFRALSETFRTERSQMAEKLAGEAPLKLMFPLLFFIFPTIFLIIMGPIVLSFFMRGGLGF